MILSLIVAMDEQRGIGRNNLIPWHLSSDLKRFKLLTMGHHLIVGRKTYESIGRSLPGRTMIIITRSKTFRAASCLVAASLNEALNLAGSRGEDEVFIGGGGMIYAQAIGKADRIYLTQVHTVVGADVFFPEWDVMQWRTSHQELLAQADGETPAYSYFVYERLFRDEEEPIDKSE